MDEVQLKDLLNKEEFEKKLNRKNSLEKSFDSDSSSWSSDEDEGNKGKVEQPIKESSAGLANTSSIPKPTLVVADKPTKNSADNLTQPKSEPSNANAFQAKSQSNQQPPQQLSLASVIESGTAEKDKEIADCKETKEDEPKKKIPVTVTVKAEVVTEPAAKEDDDDWDDDESHNSEDNGNKVLSRAPTSQPSFFQPSNSSLGPDEDKDNNEETKKLQKQNNVADLLDWSPSISDMDDEKVDSEEDALENFDDDEEDHERVEEGKEEKAISVAKSDTKLTSDDDILSSDNEKPVATLYVSKAVEQPSATSINLMDAPPSSVKKDNLIPGSKDDISANEALIGQPFEGLSPSVHLFSATPSTTSAPPPPIKPSVPPAVSPLKTSTKSLDTEIEAVPSKLPSKPSSSSGKRFFSRLLSSSESNGSSNKQSKISLQRKSSAPAPLSTLLSDTPIRLAAERRATASVSGESVGEPDMNLGSSLAVPSSKPKSFIGKMKKSLGVGKQRKSHAKSNSTALSEPCIPTHENNSCLTIPLKGRTEDEILFELFSQAKRLLEKNNYHHGAAGDESDDHQQLQTPNKRSLFPRTSTRLSVNSFNSNSKASSENSLDDLDDHKGTEDSRRKSPSKMSYYCANAVENAPNRQIVCEILQELQCVIDKSLGHNENLQVGYAGLDSELHRLKEEIACYIQTINELEIKLKHMECDNQRLLFCFEEETQARASLEKIVLELRAQIERQDECLNVECTERAVIAGELKHLEMTIQNYKNQVCDLEAEREELYKNCRGFEGKLGRTAELQNALAQCCERVDCLQKEVILLKGENNDLKLKLETACFEREKLMGDNECLRQQFLDEKACLEAKICELAGCVQELERSKTEVCRKMNEILIPHHEEMDKLKTELDRFAALYEEERKAREELQRKLRDCEEQKRLANQQQPQTDLIKQQLESTQRELNCLKSKYEEERKCRENVDRKLRDTQDQQRKGTQQQQLAVQLQLQQKELESQQKVDLMKAELDTYKIMHEQEKKSKEDMEQKLRDMEDQKWKAVQEEKQTVQFHQQQQEFHSQQKIDKLTMEVDNFKRLHNEEKEKREEAERKLRETEEQRQKFLHEQQLTTQLQQQQQENLSQQKADLLKFEIEKYKASHENEKRTRETLEQRVRDLENQNLKSLQEHQLSLQQVQQQQDMYSQQKLELLKTEAEKYRIMLDDEKRVRDDLERKLRDSEEQKTKNMLDNQEALKKQQEYYSQLHATALQQTEEEKVARELWQRELRDAQRMWESEVKAKGILAEKLARYEKQHNILDAQNKRELEELDRYKDKIRHMKSSLKSEKDLVIRLTNKLEETRNIAKTFKSQVEEMNNNPKAEKLASVVDNLKSQFELHAENSRQEKEKLMNEIYKLNQEKWRAEKESKRLSEDMKILEAEKSTWQNLAKMKDRIELEFMELKRAVNDQFVDRRDVEKLKTIYEGKLSQVKSHYEQELNVQVNERLSQFTNHLGRQSRDRHLLDKLRDTNENTLRTELHSVTKSLQVDIDNLKGLIRERDEEIVTLRKSLDIVREKYADESRQREGLMKKLQVIASHSHESIPLLQGET
ncbi:unnamed protein product [Orchesella dallaii]|uniref:Uncharacterized protein n=1 Tax=Orchesella dallaii TaxID=48710 RepID=A0ABP1R443_9HEXA